MLILQQNNIDSSSYLKPCAIKYHSEILHLPLSLVTSTTNPHHPIVCTGAGFFAATLALTAPRVVPACPSRPATSTNLHLCLVASWSIHTTPRFFNVRGRINSITKSSHPELLPHYTSPLSSHITMGSANYLLFQRLFDLPDTSYGQLWISIIEHFRNEPDDSVGLAGPSDDDETRTRFLSWVETYFDSGISQRYWGPETAGKWKLEKDRDS